MLIPDSAWTRKAVQASFVTVAMVLFVTPGVSLAHGKHGLAGDHHHHHGLPTAGGKLPHHGTRRVC